MIPAFDLPGEATPGQFGPDDARHVRPLGVSPEIGRVVHRDALGNHE